MASERRELPCSLPEGQKTAYRCGEGGDAVGKLISAHSQEEGWNGWEAAQESSRRPAAGGSKPLAGVGPPMVTNQKSL